MRNLILIILITCAFVINAQVPGNSIFDDSFLHEIRFENADTNNWINTKNYQMLNIVVDGNPVDSVGMKRKGNISKYPSTNKYAIKVKTNKYVLGKYYDGIKEFTLHMNYQDPTMLREKLTYDICEEIGLYSLRTAFAKVYINNVYWGLYTIVEGKDEMYKHKFGNRSSDAIESLDFGDMCYHGTNISEYDVDDPGNFWPRYEFSNGDPNTAWPSFINMLDKANNTINSEYLDTIPKYLNIEDFFKYQAINVYLMNFDSYISLRGNQIYVFDTLNKKWQVTPWDFNASFGLWETNNYHVTSYPMIPNSISNGCMADKLNTFPQLKNYYLDAMCELASIVCDTTTMFNKINQWKSQIQQAVYTDNRKVANNTDFDNGLEYGYHNVYGLTNVPALKTLISERYNLITQALNNEGHNCSVAVKEISEPFNNVTIFPIPVKGLLTINLDLKEETHSTIVISDILGNTISVISNNKKLSGNNQFFWSTDGVANGIYFIRIKTGKSIQVKKFIVNR